MAIVAPANSVSSGFQANLMRLEASQNAKTPDSQDAQAQDKFQDFVAGSFFKLMLKSLRSAQKPPAYMHGGQAEKIFQGQFDEQISETMAKKNGKAISGPLYPAFARQTPGLNASTAAASSASQELSHALDVIG
jgi:Rod binding domain-containing protein